jgi:hypothetical protein
LRRLCGTKVNFAGNQPAVSRPIQLLQDLAHDDLGFSARISLRVVEKVDATLIGFDHKCLSDIVSDLVTKGDPGTKRKRTDFDTRFSRVGDNP